MSNVAHQHRPSYVEGFVQEHKSFETLEELIETPWIKAFMHYPEFYQFSQEGNCLIAEYRGGREWWVVARLKEPVENLPVWNGGIAEVWDGTTKLEVLGKDVQSYCGDEVRMKDGRLLKKRRGL